MSAKPEPEEAARLEAALDRIRRAAGRPGAAAQPVEAAAIAARLDGLIEDLKSVLNSAP